VQYQLGELQRMGWIRRAPGRPRTLVVLDPETGQARPARGRAGPRGTGARHPATPRWRTMHGTGHPRPGHSLARCAEEGNHALG
jgi:hypothetical protein